MGIHALFSDRFSAFKMRYIGVKFTFSSSSFSIEKEDFLN